MPHQNVKSIQAVIDNFLLNIFRLIGVHKLGSWEGFVGHACTIVCKYCICVILVNHK